jgi:predicted Zn-dependent protease
MLCVCVISATAGRIHSHNQGCENSDCTLCLLKRVLTWRTLRLLLSYSQDAAQYARTAQLARQLEDLEKENECVRRLCALQPDNPDYVVDRANVLVRMRKVQMAAAVYRNAIKRMPAVPALYFNMDQLCRESGIAKLVDMRPEVRSDAPPAAILSTSITSTLAC